MVNSVRLPQPENALFPYDVTVLGIEKLDILEKDANAEAGRLVTPSSIVTDVNRPSFG